MATATTHSSPSSQAPYWITLVREKVEGLRYGVVQLVVHDGRVTQIERMGKPGSPLATTWVTAAASKFPPTGHHRRHRLNTCIILEADQSAGGAMKQVQL